MSLQKKGIKFIWYPKYQERFENLKRLLTKTSILKVVDPYKDYTVCRNSSKEGLGGVLSQEGHVVCYKSRKLKEHERNYVFHDLELASVVHALKMWHHYLLGTPCFTPKPPNLPILYHVTTRIAIESSCFL